MDSIEEIDFELRSIFLLFFTSLYYHTISLLIMNTFIDIGSQYSNRHGFNESVN
jgi:hypothetical protein